MNGWYAVDLDGTLATYDEWRGEEHIGEPVWPMVARVKRWLAEGKEVRVFTARVSGEREGVGVGRTREVIEQWCERYIGRRLVVTCVKDFGLIELWDDRAVRVMPNTGRRCCGREAEREEAHTVREE